MRKFFALPAQRRQLLFEAALREIGWRVLIGALPFRRIAAHLQRAQHNNAEAMESDDPVLLEDIRWALAAAARNLPLSITCLPQALAAAAMLRRRRIAGVLYIGANRTEQGFGGHAWVVARGVYLCGTQADAQMPVFVSYAC